MKVEVLHSTDNPERLVCQAARGDYYDGYVGDTEYAELMAPVDYDEDYAESLVEEKRKDWEYDRSLRKLGVEDRAVVEAQTRAFIEKQLSRGHYGPWEHPQITFAVKGVSRVTMAQITRHRHMTFDVQSQRYVDFSNKEAIVPKSLRDPEHFSRETGSVEIEASREDLERVYKRTTGEAFQRYQQLVDNGVPKEDARFVLPVGTPVNMTFSGNARTFLHLLDMRRKANAQWEIRELSEALLDELFEWCRYTFDYYADHGPNRLSP